MADQVTFGVIPNPLALSTAPRSSPANYDDIFSLLSTSSVDLQTAFVLKPQRAETVELALALREVRTTQHDQEQEQDDRGAMRAALAQEAARQSRSEDASTSTPTKSPSILRSLFSRSSLAHLANDPSEASASSKPRTRHRQRASTTILPGSKPVSQPLTRDPKLSHSHDGLLWTRKVNGGAEEEDEHQRRGLRRRMSDFTLGGRADSSNGTFGRAALPISTSSPIIPPPRAGVSPSKWFARKTPSDSSTSSPDVSPTSKLSSRSSAMSSTFSLVSLSSTTEETPASTPPQLRRKPSIPEVALEALVSLGRRSKTSPNLSDAELRSWRHPSSGQKEGDMEVLENGNRTASQRRRKSSTDDVLVIEKSHSLVDNLDVPSLSEPMSIKLDSRPLATPPQSPSASKRVLSSTSQNPFRTNSLRRISTTKLSSSQTQNNGLQPPPRPRRTVSPSIDTAPPAPRRVISSEAWSQVSISASTHQHKLSKSRSVAKRKEQDQRENGYLEIMPQTPPPSPPQLDLDEA